MKRPKAREATTHSFDELALWRATLANVKHAILPPSNDRPNPLVTDSMVVASIFSPGAVCALERKTGELLWRTEIPRFGGSSVYSVNDRFLAKSSHTLYSLDPVSGEILWTFCPCGPSGETMYSSPTAHGQSIFIGDRHGVLYCLDLRTGGTQWQRRTNEAKNDDVNSTPLIRAGLVIVATNANRAVAYDARTGELAWVQKLDGPSTFGPLLFHKFAAIFTESIYLSELETGKVVRKYSWKDDSITVATSTPRKIVGALRGNRPPSGNAQLVGVNKNRIQYSTAQNIWWWAMRYARETNLVYLSHLDGVYACDPNDGRLISDIRLREDRPEGVGVVEVQRKIIYALTGPGHVYALRHPPM
jgi:outer membrane protein assembly factor BamB